MKAFHTPQEILQIWIENGRKKAALPPGKMLLLGVMAGVYIGLGAHAFLTATAGMETPLENVLGKLIGAALFPVGLMLVILCGAELFTGNNLLVLALLERKISWRAMLRNWCVVYAGNLLGALLLSLLLARSGLYSGALAERAAAVALSKTSAPFLQLLIRGALCNLLVVLACWMQAGAAEVPGKLLSIWFPIMLFVFAGFEHSVANMTYLPLGMLLHADISWRAFLLGNLLPVTLGNLLGGALFVPCIYRFAYRAA